MTQQQCVALLREVRGLERADAAIRQAGASGEWRFVLTAIDWQLRSLRYVLSQEHPVLVASADDLLHAEQARQTNPSGPASEPAPWLVDGPASGRVH